MERPKRGLSAFDDIERLDQLGEVGKRPRQPVDLALGDPVAGGELEEERAVEPAGDLIVDVLDAGRVTPWWRGSIRRARPRGRAAKIDGIPAPI